MSVLRAVRKRKKVRKLGAIDIIRREAYADLELDAKVELIRALVPLGLLHVQELLDQEVTALAGARYARKDESVEGRRHGSNPGTVGLAGQHSCAPHAPPAASASGSVAVSRPRHFRTVGTSSRRQSRRLRLLPAEHRVSQRVHPTTGRAGLRLRLWGEHIGDADRGSTSTSRQQNRVRASSPHRQTGQPSRTNAPVNFSTRARTLDSRLNMITSSSPPPATLP